MKWIETQGQLNLKDTWCILENRFALNFIANILFICYVSQRGHSVHTDFDWITPFVWSRYTVLRKLCLVNRGCLLLHGTWSHPGVYFCHTLSFVFVSELIRKARVWASYNQFFNRSKLLTNKLMLQGFLQSPLKSAPPNILWSLSWFNFQIKPLIGSNEVWSVSHQFLGYSLKIDFDYRIRLYCTWLR